MRDSIRYISLRVSGSSSTTRQVKAVLVSDSGGVTIGDEVRIFVRVGVSNVGGGGAGGWDGAEGFVE
jgi:urease accessory protein UreH